MKAKDKAQQSRDNNLVQLTGEIEKQKASIREQIEELDSEVLTKPEVMAQQALNELSKIRKNFDKL